MTAQFSYGPSNLDGVQSNSMPVNTNSSKNNNTPSTQVDTKPNVTWGTTSTTPPNNTPTKLKSWGTKSTEPKKHFNNTPTISATTPLNKRVAATLSTKPMESKNHFNNTPTKLKSWGTKSTKTPTNEPYTSTYGANKYGLNKKVVGGMGNTKLWLCVMLSIFVIILIIVVVCCNCKTNKCLEPFSVGPRQMMASRMGSVYKNAYDPEASQLGSSYGNGTNKFWSEAAYSDKIPKFVSLLDGNTNEATDMSCTQENFDGSMYSAEMSPEPLDDLDTTTPTPKLPGQYVAPAPMSNQYSVSKPTSQYTSTNTLPKQYKNPTTSTRPYKNDEMYTENSKGPTVQRIPSRLASTNMYPDTSITPSVNTSYDKMYQHNYPLQYSVSDVYDTPKHTNQAKKSCGSDVYNQVHGVFGGGGDRVNTKGMPQPMQVGCHDPKLSRNSSARHIISNSGLGSALAAASIDTSKNGNSEEFTPYNIEGTMNTNSRLAGSAMNLSCMLGTNDGIRQVDKEWLLNNDVQPPPFIGGNLDRSQY